MPHRSKGSKSYPAKPGHPAKGVKGKGAKKGGKKR